MNKTFENLTLDTYIFLRKAWYNMLTLRDEIVHRSADPADKEIDVRCSKIPLGSGDGRWFVHPDKLSSESTIYSIGVGYDISFDLDLIHKFGCKVHAFDPTTLSCEWLSRQKLPPEFIFHKIGLANFDGKATFSLPPGHSVSFVIGESQGSDQMCEAEVKTLPTIMKSLGHHQIDLLKVDIEGAEYDIIPDLVKAPVIKQLLIEFHSRMFPDKGDSLTKDAIASLKQAGYQLFHVSRRGLEYSFIHKSCI